MKGLNRILENPSLINLSLCLKILGVLYLKWVISNVFDSVIDRRVYSFRNDPFMVVIEIY